MTNEEKLAAIEAALLLRGGTWPSPFTIGDVRWLIAEVRRLQEACDKAKAIIHNIADGSEYARGREDERRAVVAWLSSPSSECRCRDYDAIERGEHVEVKDE